MPTTLTIGGVTCTIAVDGGVREAQPERGPEAQVTYQCAYADRYALVNALLPQSLVAGGTFVRTIPHAYPPSPNLYAMECTDITGIGPKRDAEGWLVYALARLVITYRIPTFGFAAQTDPAVGSIDATGQPWTTTTCEQGGEVLKVPTGAYTLFGGAPLEESATGLIFPQYTFRVRRHFVPILPLEQTEPLIGGVNDAPVKLANKIFVKGTLMLGGMASDQQVDTTGRLVTSLEYTLMGRGRGKDWNQFLGPDGIFEFASTSGDDTGEYPFPYVQMNQPSTTFLGLP